eukprot:638294-Pyramimonas_sp.AAC.1
MSSGSGARSYHPSPPSPIAQLRKSLILKYFISTKSDNHVVLRALLDMFATGDWDSRRVQIYVPPGVPYGENVLFTRAAE